MVDTEKKVEKRGGKRLGSGRPPKSAEKRLVKAIDRNASLQQSIQHGLDHLASNYDEIMEQGIELALNGNVKMIQFLLELADRSRPPTEPDTALRKLTETWRAERKLERTYAPTEGQSDEEAGGRPAIDAEYTVIPSTS